MDGLVILLPHNLNKLFKEGVEIVVKNLVRGALKSHNNAAIGIGSMIIFIAMILVAGIAASVIIQTMNSLEEQAMKTGEETISDISSGLRVIRVNGYNDGSKISQLAIFIKTIAGSDSVDLNEAYISISDSTNQLILNYTNNCFAGSASSGLFGTINSSNLSSTTYGIIVIRDYDSSCTSTSPSINDNDLVVLMINATSCFSGIDTRTNVFGNVVPEQGIDGVIGFTTPSAFVDTILELQP